MEHLEPFVPRRVSPLPLATTKGWQLKRYAILSEGRDFDESVAQAALQAVSAQLPKAGKLADTAGNHGIGIQIIHFAETAVVSPSFFWQWGSVLAQLGQVRAPWENPTAFEVGEPQIIGCIWEMEIVAQEVQAWKETVLGAHGIPSAGLEQYLQRTTPAGPKPM